MSLFYIDIVITIGYSFENHNSQFEKGASLC